MSATDNCSGTTDIDLTGQLTAVDGVALGTPVAIDGSDPRTVLPLGLSTLVWNASDSEGNASLPLTQLVTVSEADTVAACCPPSYTVVEGNNFSNLIVRLLPNSYCIFGKGDLDTFSTGATIAFAMECFQRGLLTPDETGGLALTFGDADLIVQLVEKIARRDGSSRNFGFALGAGIGNRTQNFYGKDYYHDALRNQGDWGVSYTFERVEQNALVSIFAFSDLQYNNPGGSQRGATNVVANILRGDYVLLPHQQLTAKVLIVNALDADRSIVSLDGNPTLVRSQLDAQLTF